MPATALDLKDDSQEMVPQRVRSRRVLIVSDHPTQSLEVSKSLRALNLDIQLSLFDGRSLTSMPTTAPDAVLCHLTDYAEQGPRLAKVIRSHFKSSPIPVVGAMSRPSELASAGFDSTLFAPMHASQIANRVHAMIRLGVMEGEIERRLETLRDDFGETPTLADFSPNRKFRVLFIGKASPSFMIVINALQDKGVDVVAAFTSFSAFDYLHGEPFDAVVMNALDQSEPAYSISEAMRRNSRLYHTPTLFLVDGEKFSDHAGAYQRGARDIIDTHSDPEEISGRILELANYHSVHEQMKTDFQTLSMEVAGDASQTAYSEKFLRAHLPRVLRDAESSGHPVTLMGLRLRASSVDEVTASAVEGAYAQTIDLLGNLIRMQDVLCRWDKDILILSFYDTNASETKKILDRVNGLLNCNIFESGTPTGNGISMSAQATLMELGPEQTCKLNVLDKLIANLHHDPDAL